MFYLGFFVGWIIGILSALLFLYIIRRETESVVDGERVCSNGKENFINDPFYVKVKTGEFFFRSDLIRKYGRKGLGRLLAEGTFVNDGLPALRKNWNSRGGIGGKRKRVRHY